MGGVERVLLNRAHAFKKKKVLIKQHVLFLHDGGGLDNFKLYINKYRLGDYLEVVDVFDPGKYDIILPIDTPEVFDMTQDYRNIYIECHTSYKNNRKYLGHLPESLGGIIVPSEEFVECIIDEVPEALKKKVNFIRNCLDLEQFNLKTDYSDLPVLWNKIPLVCIGRIDNLKNTTEVIEIFVEVQKKLGDCFILIIAGPISADIDLWDIVRKKGILNRFIYLPTIQFDKVPILLSIIKKNKGIFISASKGESFGLSVAESLMIDLPVLLSDIPLHRKLVDENVNFIYRLGNVKQAAARVSNIIENYSDLMIQCSVFKEKFIIDNFIQDWNRCFT